MKFKISNSENNILDVTLDELSEVVKSEGLDKIELFTPNGWQYLQIIIEDSGFVWDEEKTTEENLILFVGEYHYLLS